MTLKIENDTVDLDIDNLFDRLNLETLAGRRILVTGGTGLLGNYIVRLLDLLVNETPNTRLFIHSRYGASLSAFDDLTRDHTYIYGDMSNPNTVNNLPEADVIICAHSYAQPLRFMAEPLTALRGSAYGLMGLLEKCSVGGRFLYISSSEVYCDCPVPPPYKETDIGMVTPYHPRACYITGKMFGEAITNLYRQRGISTVSVRPGITYGPGFRRDDQRSWCSFVRRAVETEKIKLLDAGKVMRTFCYISDGIEMLFKILLSGRQEVYNLAGETSVSIANLAKVIADAAGAKVVVPKKNHGVAGTPADLTMAMDRYNDEFGKHEYTPFTEGMTRTVRWYEDTHA